MRWFSVILGRRLLWSVSHCDDFIDDALIPPPLRRHLNINRLCNFICSRLSPFAIASIQLSPDFELLFVPESWIACLFQVSDNVQHWWHGEWRPSAALDYAGAVSKSESGEHWTCIIVQRDKTEWNVIEHRMLRNSYEMAYLILWAVDVWTGVDVEPMAFHGQ